MTAKYVWKNSEITHLKENYFLQEYKEMSLVLGISVSVICRKAKELGLPDKTKRNKIEYGYKKPVGEVLKTLHIEKQMSVNQIAKLLGTSRKSIVRWMNESGIQQRDRSEAEQLKWKNMTAAKRRQQVVGAHRKNTELLKSGKHNFQRWWAENKVEATRLARIAAPLGSIEREKRGTNGMLGKCGPAHPRWRGGKDEYHRLRSLAPGDWAANRKLTLKRDDNKCQDCGLSVSETIIDVHHIICLRDSGTNHLGNLITLCRSCHQKTEWSVKE